MTNLLWIRARAQRRSPGMLAVMTARKPRDPDTITSADAAAMLHLTEDRVARLRRDGLLARLEGYPSYSRADVQEFINNPWLTGAQAALLLGVSHTRVSQLADDEKIPCTTPPADDPCTDYNNSRWSLTPAASSSAVSSSESPLAFRRLSADKLTIENSEGEDLTELVREK
jgi:hypothetical protein